MSRNEIVLQRGSFAKTAKTQDMRVWERASEIVLALLDRCELKGSYKFILKVQKRTRMQGDSNDRGSLAVGIFTTAGVYLKVRPGDNGTVWKYLLVAPSGIDPEMLHGAMLVANGQMGRTVDEYEDGPAGKPDGNGLKIVSVPTTGNDILTQVDAAQLAGDEINPTGLVAARTLKKSLELANEIGGTRNGMSTLDGIDSLIAGLGALKDVADREKKLRHEYELLDEEKLTVNSREKKLRDELDKLILRKREIDDRQIEILNTLENDPEITRAATVQSLLEQLSGRPINLEKAHANAVRRNRE